MSNIIFNYLLSVYRFLPNLRIRFAPEPSGLIHFGHLKTLTINFLLSKIFKINFIIRIDNTNPLKSKSIYCFLLLFHIFLFYYKQSFLITFSSNYFFRIYLIIKDLLKIGLLYIEFFLFINFSNNILIKIFGIRSFLKRLLFEQIYLLKNIRIGFFKDREFVLCYFINNYVYYNKLVIARIKLVNSIFIINRWFLYPSYDFSNAIIDCFENICVSICTNEFTRNRIYYNNIVNLYSFLYIRLLCCLQIEISKLLFNKYKKISKRILNSLINNKINFSFIRLPVLFFMILNGFSKKFLMFFILNIGLTKKYSIIKYSFFRKSYFRFLLRYYLYFNIYLLLFFKKNFIFFLKNNLIKINFFSYNIIIKFFYNKLRIKFLCFYKINNSYLIIINLKSNLLYPQNKIIYFRFLKNKIISNFIYFNIISFNKLFILLNNNLFLINKSFFYRIIIIKNNIYLKFVLLK